MTGTTEEPRRVKSRFRKWVRIGFITWASFVMIWLGNSYRTRGVPAATMRSDATVTVIDETEALAFLPKAARGDAGLVFICGSGVTARAYAPMLRPIAEAGYPAFIVRLPYRFAPFASHKDEAVDRARRVVESHPEIRRWVIAGHSLGGALACRLVQADPELSDAMVLIGTTHPKSDNLSHLPFPVTKVFGTNDGVAPAEKVLAGRHRLPELTRWIEIPGGNHSQFGHYGHQLFDGKAGISRENQQQIARQALIEALSGVSNR